MRSSCPSGSEEGAGNAGRWPHPQPCVQERGQQRTQVVTTGSPKHSGIPCAMVLSAAPCSPRSIGLVSLRPPGLLDPGVDPSVEGTGPHGLTVRACPRSSREPPRPPLPASRFVTIAQNVPLHEAGFRINSTISGFRQEKDLTTPPDGGKRLRRLGNSILPQPGCSRCGAASERDIAMIARRAINPLDLPFWQRAYGTALSARSSILLASVSSSRTLLWAST